MRWLNLVSSRHVSILKPYTAFGHHTSPKTSVANSVPASTGCRCSSLTPPLKTTMEESEVGIFCYISQLPGFRGILKQRYSDFIVNEVDRDGNVVHLTSMDVPPEIMEAVEEGEKKVAAQVGKNYASEIEAFRSLAGDSDADSLEIFINQVTSATEDSNGISPILLSSSSDKAHRTAVHNFFKEKFKFLVTDTVDGPDASSKCIRVRLNSRGHNDGGRNSKKRKDRGDRPFDSRGSDNWPENIGKFLRFHLYKENKDTQECIGLIGKMLGIQTRSFGFAGTKDKRAITTQRVTVFKQHASRLAALNDRLIGIKVGDFCYVREGLLLGQLLGNRFTVTLRGVVAESEDIIKGSAESLGKHGFINYFGLQRFGSGSVPTHLVGAALLRGEWKTAVNMILDPREGERDAVRKVREYYKESNDIDGTLRQLPRYLTAERSILQCLKKCPGNYLQALKAIPRTLRMMYVHSYQSYLWNHAASMRVQKYGADKVVVGDLVYCKGNDTEREPKGVNPEFEEDTCDDMYECDDLDDTPGPDLPETKNALVKALTVEDLSAGNYTIDDVILPMPGSRVVFPSNEVADVYHDLAKKDGISLSESVHSVKEFSITSMTGSYRRVFQKPMDFQWELLSYTDVNAPLAETDYDKFAKGKFRKPVNEEQANGNGNKSPPVCSNLPLSYQSDEHLSMDDKKAEAERAVEVELAQKESLPDCKVQEAQSALKLSFTLPSSCYATMAIRELLKTSTSVAFHKTLNQ